MLILLTPRVSCGYKAPGILIRAFALPKFTAYGQQAEMIYGAGLFKKTQRNTDEPSFNDIGFC